MHPFPWSESHWACCSCNLYNIQMNDMMSSGTFFIIVPWVQLGSDYLRPPVLFCLSTTNNQLRAERTLLIKTSCSQAAVWSLMCAAERSSSKLTGIKPHSGKYWLTETLHYRCVVKIYPFVWIDSEAPALLRQCLFTSDYSAVTNVTNRDKFRTRKWSFVDKETGDL